MARYIKLEDAIEVCGKYKDFHKKENSRLGVAIVNDIYLDIDNLPTADVEEVKHGEWIKKPFVSDLLRKTVKSEFIYTCSVCGYDSISESNYCRNCGAKMDGGKEE